MIKQGENQGTVKLELPQFKFLAKRMHVLAVKKSWVSCFPRRYEPSENLVSKVEREDRKESKKIKTKIPQFMVEGYQEGRSSSGRVGSDRVISVRGTPIGQLVRAVNCKNHVEMHPFS
jgi:hypothetical protein